MKKTFEPKPGLTVRVKGILYRLLHPSPPGQDRFWLAQEIGSVKARRLDLQGDEVQLDSHPAGPWAWLLERQCWLHFIGKMYYTPKTFAEEAKRLGVSRRVARRVLSVMNWGDVIFVAQGDLPTKRRKSQVKETVVFGYFTLERITGLPPDVLQWAMETGGGRLVNVSRAEKRGCGELTVGLVLKLAEPDKVPVSEIVRRLPKNEDVKLLIGGPFRPLLPFVKLPDVRFSWGFRRINPEFLLYARAHDNMAPGDWKPKVSTPSDHSVELSQAELASLQEYELKDPYGVGRAAPKFHKDPQRVQKNPTGGK